MMRFVKKAEREADIMLLLVDLKRSYVQKEMDKKMNAKRSLLIWLTMNY